MKIEIDIDEKYPDICVKVTTPALTPEVERIVSLIRIVDMQIPVKKDDETVLLDASTILYIEAVERSTFVYTEDETYESGLKLYEFENQLSQRDFIRISVKYKQVISAQIFADNIRKVFFRIQRSAGQRSG